MSSAAAPAPGDLRAVRANALSTIGLLTVGVFVAVVFGYTRRHPSFGGMIAGGFGGVITAGVFALGARWTLERLFVPTPEPTDAPASAGVLRERLGPVLRELEATRVDTAGKINARLATRLPLGLAAGVAVWAWSQLGTKPAGWVQLGLFSAIGGGAGWWWAAGALSTEYARLYKSRVLPRLVADFGELDWRPAKDLELAALRKENLVEAFDSTHPDDEIFGRYRGLPLSIAEVRLTHGSGKEQREIFDGLVTCIELPRRLAGVTAVVNDGGLFNALRGRKDRQRVRLEDPDFERMFEVYGSDQIASRALLTPAFMERFIALAGHPGFGRSLALAQDNRLTIATPKAGAGNLLEPPGYDKPADSATALAKLHDDLQALLGVADAVIDLDQSSRAVASARPTV